MRYLFGLALLAICLAYNVQLHAAEKSTSYSKKQVLADINQLVRLLKRNHPNLYAHQNSKKFKATIKKVKSEVTQKMSRLDAAIQFQKILASVCDEHTGIVFSPKNERATYGSARYLDSSLILRQGRIVVGNNRKSTNSEVILKIGNHQADEINSYMQSLHSQDGCLDTNTDVIGGANYQSMLFLGNFFKDIKFGPTLEFRNHSTQVVRRNGMFFSFTRVVESLGYVHAVKMIMADIVIKKEGFVYEKSDFSKDFFDGNISSYLYHNEEFNYFYAVVRQNTTPLGVDE